MITACSAVRSVGATCGYIPVGLIYVSVFASVRHLWEKTEDVNLKEMS